MIISLPMRLPLRLLVAFTLLFAAATARAEELRIVEPRAGSTLRGGTFAQVSWAANELPRGSEEWEAFLSINGGRYYAFRITPHLDADLRAFTFVVPNVATDSARILIRTGNEKREVEFESASTFRIEYDARANDIAPHILQFGRGEAARVGDPDVLSWADGSRRGAGLTQVAGPTRAPLRMHAVATLEATESAELPRVMQSLSAPQTGAIRRFVTRNAPRVVTLVASTPDLLLVCRRRNI